MHQPISDLPVIKPGPISTLPVIKTSLRAYLGLRTRDRTVCMKCSFLFWLAIKCNDHVKWMWGDLKPGVWVDAGNQGFWKFKQCTGKSGRGVSKSTSPAKFSLALACWPLSFISPGDGPGKICTDPWIFTWIFSWIFPCPVGDYSHLARNLISDTQIVQSWHTAIKSGVRYNLLLSWRQEWQNWTQIGSKKE